MLLQCLALTGALATVDATACTPDIAWAILGNGGDYLLAVKGNQVGLQTALESYLLKAHEDKPEGLTLIDKDYDRTESDANSSRPTWTGSGAIIATSARPTSTGWRPSQRSKPLSSEPA